jgi:hypothetical protein
MSAIYIVNFSDLLKTGLAIQPNSENGPGFTQTDTDLYLHGAGSLRFGEKLNENFLHLLETFAGATAPTTPIEGQRWHKIQLYWKDTNAVGSPIVTTWHRWNFTTSLWDTITVTSDTTAPTSPDIGDYWFNTSMNILQRWDKVENQSATWITREYTSNVIAPTGSDRPPYHLMLWNGANWVNSSNDAVFVTDTDYPIMSTTSLDIDTSITESAWESVGPTGSGANNIWTALDSLPSDVDWIEVKIVSNHTSNADTANTSRTASLHSRNNGSLATISAMSQISYLTSFTSAAGNCAASSVNIVKLNVLSRKFDLYWMSTFANTADFTAILTGYGYNGA